METGGHVTGAATTQDSAKDVTKDTIICSVSTTTASQRGVSELPDARRPASHSSLRQDQLRRSPRQSSSPLNPAAERKRVSLDTVSPPAPAAGRVKQPKDKSMPKPRQLQRSRKSTSLADTQPQEPSEEWYTIRGILRERKIRGRLQYLVDWDDNPQTGKTYSPTWVPSNQVTQHAVKEWRRAKRQRHKGGQKPSPGQCAADSDDSQPPRPANWRSLKRANAFPDSATAQDSPPAKVPKLAYSLTPSEEPAPSITSTACDTSLDASELGSELPSSHVPPNHQIVVEVKTSAHLDPSEYVTAQSTQDTSSQSLAELEAGDERVVFASQISRRTIPDSQEPSGSTWPSCPATDLAVSAGPSAPSSRESFASYTTSQIPARQPASPSAHQLESPNIFRFEAGETQHQPALVSAPASQASAPHGFFVPQCSPQSASQCLDTTTPSSSFVKQTQPQDEEGPIDTSRPAPAVNESQDAQIISRSTIACQAFSRSQTVGRESSEPASSHNLDEKEEREKGERTSLGSGSQNLLQARDMTDACLSERPDGRSAAPVDADQMPDEHLKMAGSKDSEQFAFPPSSSASAEYSETARAMHAIVDAAWDGTDVSVAAPNAASLDAVQLQPPTVSPADISKQTDTTLSDKALQPSPAPVPVDSPQESVAMSCSSESSSENGDQGLSEFVITLPFQSSHRPLYDDTLLSAEQEATEFGQIFSAEIYTEPDQILVRKIDQLFGRLHNICDYPQDTIGTVLEDLPPAQLAKYCCDGNPKFNFIFELLQGLRKETRILIVARSVELLRLLHHTVEALGVDCTCAAIDKLTSSNATSTVHVALILPTEDVNALDFDVVVGYDHSFSSCSVAKSLSSAGRIPKRLLILALVTTHSIEHIDLHLPEGLGHMERKNALLSSVVKARRLVADPDRGCPEPHEVAANFYEFLNGETEILAWDSVPVPDDVLDIFVASQALSQPSAVDAPEESERSTLKRKHQHGLDEKTGDAKRLRTLLNNSSTVESNEPPLSDDIQEMLDSAGFSTPQASTSKMQVKVPISVLQTLAEMIAENRRQIAANDADAEYKAVINNLEARVKEYERSTNEIYHAHQAALEDRSKFEEAKKEAEGALKFSADEVQKENDKTDQEIAKLHAKIDRLLGTPAGSKADSAGGSEAETPLARNERLLEKAQDKIQVLEKRLRNAHDDVEYMRTSYQEASSAASALQGENSEFKEQIEALRNKASNNLEKIHKIQAQEETKLLEHHIRTLKAQVKDREWELDRLRDEVRQLKNGRRETRQVSVPRSPRMSVMSPRTSRVVGSFSRGNSPAPLTGLDGPAMSSGMQYTSTQQPGNGRWNPLRE